MREKFGKVEIMWDEREIQKRDQSNYRVEIKWYEREIWEMNHK